MVFDFPSEGDWPVNTWHENFYCFSLSCQSHCYLTNLLPTPKIIYLPPNFLFIAAIFFGSGWIVGRLVLLARAVHWFRQWTREIEWNRQRKAFVGSVLAFEERAHCLCVRGGRTDRFWGWLWSMNDQTVVRSECFLKSCGRCLGGWFPSQGSPQASLFKKVIAGEKPTIGCDSPFFVKWYWSVIKSVRSPNREWVGSTLAHQW
jgi:hypothetical protein